MVILSVAGNLRNFFPKSPDKAKKDITTKH